MIVELTKEYEKKWNDYLNKNLNSTIFHTLEWKELTKKNYGYEPLYFLSLESNQVNGILPLFHIKSIEEIKNNYHKRLRKNLRTIKRNVEKNDIVFEFVEDEDSFKQFYNILLKETIKKHKSIFHSYNFFNELYKTNKLFVAKKNKKILAGMFMLIHNREVKYFLAASDLRYKSLSLSTILVDKAIEWAVKNNFKIFDMGLNSPSQESLLGFKKKWNPKIHNVCYYYYLINKKKKIKQFDFVNSYKKTREILKYIPPTLIKPFLPFIIKQFG